MKGKPWFTYEAFQWIIKLQVEFLIKHGVDPALKVQYSVIIIIMLVLVFCGGGKIGEPR